VSVEGAVTVRAADAGDERGILSLGPASDPISESLALLALGSEGGFSLVAEIAGTIAGHLMVAGPRRSDGGGEIALFVGRPWRRRGVARALLSEAFREADRRQMARLWVRVAPDNGAARRLYESAGMARTGERDGALVYERQPKSGVDC
jgi:ribosomal protein S18 acetylase RimI-like enzyme